MYWLTTLIIVIFALGFLVEGLSELLNLRYARGHAPESKLQLARQEFDGTLDTQHQGRMADYQSAQTRVHLLRTAIVTLALIAMIAFGGFQQLDLWVRELGHGPVIRGLLFAGALGLGQLILSLPFSIASTFGIEERFGFNRTTPKVFITDLGKGIALTAILGGLVLAGVIAFFAKLGPHAWIYAWIAVTLFQLFMLWIAPVLILPLFNRFNPLPDGILKQRIQDHVNQQGFQIAGIYVMDGSKRSSKANAFFTGMGRYRKLVLFDTLVDKQSPEEVVAVLAHEIGHFRLKHIPRSIALALAITGIFFYGFSIGIRSPELFQAFGIDRPSIYAGLILIGILYSPVSRLFSIFSHWLSRQHEYEADEYSARTYGHPEILITSLKKLSTDHLSNPTPHPLKVWLDYTHPPILERIAALRKLESQRVRV